jgi:hypothetical protein
MLGDFSRRGFFLGIITALLSLLPEFRLVPRAKKAPVGRRFRSLLGQAIPGPTVSVTEYDPLGWVTSETWGTATSTSLPKAQNDALGTVTSETYLPADLPGPTTL